MKKVLQFLESDLDIGHDSGLVLDGDELTHDVEVLFFEGLKQIAISLVTFTGESCDGEQALGDSSKC